MIIRSTGITNTPPAKPAHRFIKIFSRIIRNIFILTATAILCTELIIHLLLRFLPINVQNLVLTKYTTDISGIYFDDPRYNIQILKPDFLQKDMFFNGYYWRHKTNHIGIRDNRDIEKADIVLLGDSMVYGHGLNFADTIGYNLEKISGLTVANLALQGDYPPFEYVRLKKLGLFLRPRFVFFFIFGVQDESDFRHSRPSQGYIERIVKESPPNYMAGLFSNDYLQNYNHNPTFQQIIESTLTARIIKLIKSIKKDRTAQTKPYDESNIEKVMVTLLPAADKLCRENGAKFVVILHHDSAANNFQAISKRICLAHRITVLDFNNDGHINPKKPSPYYLKMDGHYSAQGTRYVAEKILKFLKTQSFPLTEKMRGGI